MLFLIGQIKHFGTLNAMQKKRRPLQTAVFEKIKKNCQNLAVINKKCIFDCF